MDVDTSNESYNNESLQSLVKNRVAGIPFSSSLISSDYLNDILTHVNLIGLSSTSEDSGKKLDLDIEQYLHDLGVISIINSASLLAKQGVQVGNRN